MSNHPATKQIPVPLLQWILWAAITTGLIVIYFSMGQRIPPPAASSFHPSLTLGGIFPLLLSAAIRWVFLPRVAEPPKRLPLFIVGLGLAEGCGLIGIFIGGPHKDTLFVLGLLGLAQFFPAFLPRTTPVTSSFR